MEATSQQSLTTDNDSNSKKRKREQIKQFSTLQISTDEQLSQFINALPPAQQLSNPSSQNSSTIDNNNNNQESIEAKPTKPGNLPLSQE